MNGCERPFGEQWRRAFIATGGARLRARSCLLSSCRRWQVRKSGSHAGRGQTTRRALLRLAAAGCWCFNPRRAPPDSEPPRSPQRPSVLQQRDAAVFAADDRGCLVWGRAICALTYYWFGRGEAAQRGRRAAADCRCGLCGQDLAAVCPHVAACISQPSVHSSPHGQGQQRRRL